MHVIPRHILACIHTYTHVYRTETKIRGSSRQRFLTKAHVHTAHMSLASSLSFSIPLTKSGLAYVTMSACVWYGSSTCAYAV